ncbi:uncharacterized protein F4812DRAFT_230900 [Daldinia caldariorum]|uniref:uncharacterized protein n=1 Tax=Daldinia caldariorum TaxID=326644 RepID=UPI002008440C|nr:uncharacterized protein F4812DRAFT_230900 [Daldinia caldariorum]KAI1463780.1 hypothetical protein F4812DRAFT_230900 [Daldinia caldariorum]
MAPVEGRHLYDQLASSSMSSSESQSQSPEPLVAPSLFTKFTELPPELRHQIWRMALPVPGINFFNVHCIPNDHPGTNRSTSPSWLYLDLRRLSIDDDDETVSEYDPSAWQAREILCRVCREARDVCSLSPAEAAAITLTRPRRGLFVRAADGQLRELTPVRRRSNFTGEEPDQSEEKEQQDDHPEPLERRTVRVHVDDVLCLSIENCSFNLPFEETPVANGGGFVGETFPYYSRVSDDDEDDLGWTYDPQLTPLLPAAIRRSRMCIEMARGGRIALQVADEVLRDMLSFSQNRNMKPWEMLHQVPLVMFDASKQELGQRRVEELTPWDEVFWDRHGDRYVALPWSSTDLLADYKLTKVWPETNDIRVRYLRSAMLQSPKRPANRPS